MKNKPAIAENFDFNDSGLGVPNLLVDGFTSAKSTVNAKHPLYQSEQNVKFVEHLNFIKLIKFYIFSTKKTRSN